MEEMVKADKKTESYLNQLRIQTDHFRRYFNGEKTKFVKSIDIQQIEDYFLFEEKNKASRASIAKYKSHLNAIWRFMLKDKDKYGVKENVVAQAEITAPKSAYKASVLDYKELNELIYEATKLEDPSFLYLVVFSMTQGMRRGELCGLMWEDIDFEKCKIIIRHNRVQLNTSDTLKLPKCEKIREIELHNAGFETIKIYKRWQEKILGRKVQPKEFVLQWEINLLQNYVCSAGKISRRWKEIFNQINKNRESEEKVPLPYGRIHDGRHTYITLCLQGVKKDDGSIISPASFIQVYQSAGHTIPRAMQNTSLNVYNEDVNARWDVTRFWNEIITTNISESWDKFQEIRRQEFEKLNDFEKAKKEAQKKRRLEKAQKERLCRNTPKDTLIEYK